MKVRTTDLATKFVFYLTKYLRSVVRACILLTSDRLLYSVLYELKIKARIGVFL